MSEILVNEKNTKSEILRAYDELLQKVRESSQPNRKAEKEAQEKRETVKAAQGYSNEKIIKSLADIKLEMAKSFEQLETLLSTEAKNLFTIQEAIEIENKRLEEIHEIRANADSLAALLLAQKEKKAEFEVDFNRKRQLLDLEILETKEQWKKETDIFEASFHETKSNAQKQWKREEEEYKYKISLERKKDSDAYAQQKADLERELAEQKNTFDKQFIEREQAIKQQENELQDLRLKVENFPIVLQKSIADAQKNAVEKIELNHKYQTELKAKEVEGKLKLYEQMIAQFETKILEKDNLITQLTEKANQAGAQVQDIAVKAIEGASSQRAFNTMFTKSLEQDKVGKLN